MSWIVIPRLVSIHTAIVRHSVLILLAMMLFWKISEELSQLT